MNSKVMTRMCLIAAGGLLGFAASAGTWYFTGNETSTDTGAFTDPTKWKDASGTAATAFNAADTYVLTNFGPGEAAATMHIIRAHGGTFANGARLELNGYHDSSANRKDQRLLLYSDCSPDNPVVFTRGLLFGNNARIFPQNGNCINVISGQVNLVAANGGQIPTVQPSARNNTLVFADGMTGGDRLGMFVYPGSDGSHGNFTVKFLGNVTWGGQMYVRDANRAISLTHCAYNVRLTFGNITFKPEFRIDGNGSYVFSRANTLMRFAVDTVNDTVTFKNGIDTSAFPLYNDTYLEFPVDATTGKAGKMVLETQLYGRTNACIGVILTGNPFSDTTNRFELMSVPVAQPLNASAFRLVGDSNGKIVKFEVVNDATHSTLYAVVPPMVRYLQPDNGSQAGGYGTRINQNDGWSDGAAAQPGRDYLVLHTNVNDKYEFILRTPDSDTSASYTFPGRSLTIAANASLRSYVKELHIDDLRLLDGSRFYVPSADGANRKLTVTGNIDISGTARIGTYSSHTVCLANSFTGDGTIDFGGLWIAANAYASYSLSGDNSGFTGKMIVRTAYRDGNITLKLDTDCGNLGFDNVQALGANLPSLAYDAIVLTDYAQLSANNITISKASNRGITIKDAGCFWTSSNKKMCVETPLTVDGTFYKRGTGELTLAGPTIAVTGGGADKCVIQHGPLRVAHADALKGLALEFESDGKNIPSLTVVPDITDADFTAKGIDLSGIDTPITLDADFNGKIPFQDTPAAARPEAPFGVTEYGLLTVKATAADAIRAMLPTTPPRHFAGGTMTWTEKATEDCVTFCVRCRRPATAIYLR